MGFEQTVEEPDQGRLAAAVGAAEEQELTVGYVEADSFEGCRPVGVCVSDIANFNHLSCRDCFEAAGQHRAHGPGDDNRGCGFKGITDQKRRHPDKARFGPFHSRYHL